MAMSILSCGNKRVADMNDPHKPVEGCRCQQKTAGVQDAEHFREDLVFQFLRKNVMQHGDETAPENSASPKGIPVASSSRRPKGYDPHLGSTM